MKPGPSTKKVALISTALHGREATVLNTAWIGNEKTIITCKLIDPRVKTRL